MLTFLLSLAFIIWFHSCDDCQACLMLWFFEQFTSEICSLFGGEIFTNWSMMLQVSADQRERLSMSVERLNQSGDRIKESRRTMLETEELGVSILEDLHQQRQTLLHAHNKVFSLSLSPSLSLSLSLSPPTPTLWVGMGRV